MHAYYFGMFLSISVLAYLNGVVLLPVLLRLLGTEETRHVLRSYDDEDYDKGDAVALELSADAAKISSKPNGNASEHSVEKVAKSCDSILADSVRSDREAGNGEAADASEAQGGGEDNEQTQAEADRDSRAAPRSSVQAGIVEVEPWAGNA